MQTASGTLAAAVDVAGALAREAQGEGAAARWTADAGLDGRSFRSRLHALFNDIHVLVVPALQTQVPTAEEYARLTDEMIMDLIRFASPFSMSGHPTITLPCGFASGRSPISMQLVGPYFGEGTLIKVADAFQRETDWHRRYPIP